MNNFNIDKEIDRLVDKFSEDLRVRLKKSVARSEKLILKQYIASQRNTAPLKSVRKTSSPTSSKRQSTKPVNRNLPRKKNVRYNTSDSDSD